MVGLVSALRILGGGLHNYGFTVFFLPVSQELGLSRASTSLAFSLARAQGSFLSPLVGHLVDRHGPKPMMIAASLLDDGPFGRIYYRDNSLHPNNGLERPKSDPSICSARGICHLQLAPSLRAGVDW